MQGNGTRKASIFTILRMLKRRKAWLIIPVVLITGGAALYSRRMPQRFRARALVASQAPMANPYINSSPDAASLNVQEHLRTIRETILSAPVLETVIRELDVYPAKESTDLAAAAQEMKSRVQILVEGPDAFYVGFEGTEPQQVMQVANRLATLFVQRTSELHGQREASVDNVLDSEVARLRRQLDEQEGEVRNYRQNAAQALPDRVAANLKRLEDLQQQAQAKSDQIADAQSRRTAIVNEMLSLENQGALEAAPREQTTNEKTIEDLRLKLSQLKARYTRANPEIDRTEKEIRDLEALGAPPGARREPSQSHMRYVALQAELPAIDQRIKSLQQERAALISQVGSYEKRVDSSPGLEATLTQHMRDAALTRAQYEALLAKQQAAKLDQRVEKSSREVAFRVMEPAQLPLAPYTPKRRDVIALAFLASLGLGLAGVFLAEHMDSSFQTAEEMQEFSNLTVLSSVPTIDNSLGGIRPGRNGHNGGIAGALLEREGGIGLDQRRHFQKHRLAVAADPQSIASQQYGILTLKVHRWREHTGSRVLVVTSAAGGEGKSLTALNLSMALAGSVEGRVLLVDCDLRRPQVHERLGLKGVRGFSDLLITNETDVSPFITKVGNLHVMTGGNATKNAGGNLSARRTREVLASLKDEFEMIVLDSPPIVPIADSHFLAALSDGVILVIRARQTRRELLRRAVESLEATNILGVVLNDVEFADTRYAYAYRYYERHYTRR